MNSDKLIVVLLDGLRRDAAFNHLGFLAHMYEKGLCSRHTVRAELPSNSRPLYETLMTGVTPYESGIVNNEFTRFSKEESLFHLTRAQGLTNAASAYCWFRELYYGEHFTPLQRHLTDNGGPINHGIFYFAEYSDTHVFMDGEYLRTAYQPDFLFIHPANIDHVGHLYGSNSKEYLGAIITAEDSLSLLVPRWLEAGYQVVVTADHGMLDSGDHGGVSDTERLAPLFIFSQKTISPPNNEPIPQYLLAPLFCSMMKICPSAKMKSLEGWRIEG